MGIFQARILEWVAMASSRGIFPIQGSNPGLSHCRQISYQPRHQGNPRILEWAAYPFSRDLPNPGIKPGSLLHCRWILYHLSYQGSASIGEAGIVPICIIDEEAKFQGAWET